MNVDTNFLFLLIFFTKKVAIKQDINLAEICSKECPSFALSNLS